jgi:hypothetical protein
MSEAPFPKHISDALDRYDVPPLPDGFADRLIARATSESEPSLPPLRPRRSLGGRWQRSAFIAGAVGLFGMVTAAAAATGFFGEPVYVPVVSEALAKANIAPMPKIAKAQPPKAKPVPAKQPAIAKVEAPAGQPIEPKIPDGTEQARSTIREMWQDPAFRQLPKEERRMAAKERLRAGIAEGRYTREELKSAMQAMQAERAERRDQREAARAAFGLPDKPKRQWPAGDPEQPAAAVPNANEPAAIPPKAKQRLRERLENATPEERERILAKIRERREARRAARAAQQSETAPTTEAVAEPPK